jgi:hypothetical protein
MDAAGWPADDERSEKTSFPGDHDELCIGKENAIPGYDKTYSPIPDSLPASG